MMEGESEPEAEGLGLGDAEPLQVRAALPLRVAEGQAEAVPRWPSAAAPPEGVAWGVADTDARAAEKEASRGVGEGWAEHVGVTAAQPEPGRVLQLPKQAGQGVQADAPAGAKVLGGHSAQVALEAAPVAAEKVLGGQSVALTEEKGQKEPGGHSTGAPLAQ